MVWLVSGERLRDIGTVQESPRKELFWRRKDGLVSVDGIRRLGR
jgi:hypothetical protein